jgi:hypothetical protein
MASEKVADHEQRPGEVDITNRGISTADNGVAADKVNLQKKVGSKVSDVTVLVKFEFFWELLLR